MKITHGKSYDPIYSIWWGVVQRCRNPKHRAFHLYGGRGIRVLWKSFEDFYADMGDAPAPGMSIDRIDNDGHYCKQNCRWATDEQQSNNRKNTKKLMIRGEEFTAAQLARRLGVTRAAIYFRLRNGWPVEKMLEARGPFGPKTNNVA